MHTELCILHSPLMFPAQYPIRHQIIPLSIFFDMLPETSFVSHPDLLHHASRRRVTCQVMRVDAMKLERSKTETE